MPVQDIILHRFQRFKDMFISANLPYSELLDLLETYLFTSNDDLTVLDTPPVLDGQLSLFNNAEEMVINEV